MDRKISQRMAQMAVVVAALAVGASCGSDGSSDPAPSDGDDAADGEAGGDGAADGEPGAGGDVIDEAAVAACSESDTLIETTEWPLCLAGKRVAGTEPFNGTPCELRIGQNGAFTYLRSGTVALSVPERTDWPNASGTYQNQPNPNGRIFLAGLSLSLPVVEGEPRVTNLTLTFLGANLDDKVEVAYLDADLARQVYTCSVDVL